MAGAMLPNSGKDTPAFSPHSLPRRRMFDGRWFLSVLFLILLQFGDSETGELDCKGVTIVSRKEWRARPQPRFRSMKMPVNDVIIQHTVSDTCKTKAQCIRNIQFIEEYHVDYLGWGDIAYNFLVGGDGRVYEGRGWTVYGTHTYNMNKVSLGVAFIGNYMEVEPSQKMLNAALRLIDCGVEKGFLTPTREIHGHRDIVCTLSPGDKLYAIIRKWKNFKGGKMPEYNCRP